MSAYGSLQGEDGQVYPLINKINLIGRANHCVLTLKHLSVSKEHALIEFDNNTNQAILKDLESLNGIFQNNVRIPKGSNRVLKDTDILQFGKDPTRYRFVTNQINVHSNENNYNQKSNNKQTKSKDFKISVTDYALKDNDIYEHTNTDNKFLQQQQQQQKQISNPVNKFEGFQNTQQLEAFNKQQKPFNPLPLADNDNEQQQQKIAQQLIQDQNQQQQQQIQNQNLQAQNIQNQQYENQQLIDKLEQQKNELEQKNIQLNEINIQKEEKILSLENQLQKINQQTSQTEEQTNKQKAKLHALELYCSEQQQKIDRMNDDSLESRKMLEEVFKQDWGKKLHQNELEITNLRNILVQKDDELDYYRKQLATHFSTCKDYNHNFNNHLQFVEQQTKQLSLMKKQIIEHENQRNECQKKWTSLLQENMEKEEKIKGQKIQIERQIEKFQETFQETDKRINDYNMQILKSLEVGDIQQYEAAQFLVEQMKIIQEERKNVTIENENLHTQIQDLISEIERMKNDLSHYEGLFEVSVQDLSQTNNNRTLANIGPKIKIRCQELEDLVNELKQKGGVSKAVDMAELLEQLEKQLQLQKNRNQELMQQMRDFKSKNIGNQNEQNCIEFFSKLIDEKDKRIVQLQNLLQTKESKEKNYLQEIENLNYKLDNGIKQLLPNNNNIKPTNNYNYDPKKSNNYDIDIDEEPKKNNNFFENYNYEKPETDKFTRIDLNNKNEEETNNYAKRIQELLKQNEQLQKKQDIDQDISEQEDQDNDKFDIQFQQTYKSQNANGGLTPQRVYKSDYGNNI